MDVDEDPQQRPSLSSRTSSKRRLSDVDDAATLAALSEPSEKRQRAPVVLPPSIQAAIAAHQAAFDSHTLALSTTAEWSDAARRVMRIAAFCSHHPPRLRELVDATAVDLSEVRAIETSVADAASTAPGRVQMADLSFQRRQRDILVDSALRRIRTAQQNRAAATAALRTELGGPWTDEEAQHWAQLDRLDEAEDLVHSLLLAHLLGTV